MDKETIIQYLKAEKPEFERKFGIRKIGLFGSYARRQNRSNSDIDIVVEIQKPDLLTLVGIKQKIEEDLGIKVDIVRYRARMNHSLKKRIKRYAVYA